MGYLWGLLAKALNALVTEGIIQEQKLVTFDLPVYSPSMEEVKAVIHKDDQFDTEQAQIFETNWDPYDD
ncbi:hypothetical protein OPV22_024370 [Ensete ventricosum]|uniref:Uncharacterized protein n=1 Tax=Ensete ventricosum TaxID=4639 RepID=A0AAV8QZ07_ENSVE|nr:hypothetical protein OPV22_024370 [Ensete ventricosum]